MRTVGIFTVTVVLMIVSAVFNGYALSVLWGWFVVPVFGLSELTIPVAIGLSILVGFLAKDFTVSRNDATNEEPFVDKLLRATVVAVCKPSFALFFGWIATLWM